MKVLIWLLIVALTLYAPVELTRYILLIMGNHPVITPIEFICEIIFIWIFYIAGMIIVWKCMKG